MAGSFQFTVNLRLFLLQWWSGQISERQKEHYTLGLCAPVCQMSSESSTEENTSTENCTMASVLASKVSLNVQSSDDDFMKRRRSYIESNTKPFQEKYKAIKNEATWRGWFGKEMMIVNLQTKIVRLKMDQRKLRQKQLQIFRITCPSKKIEESLLIKLWVYFSLEGYDTPDIIYDYMCISFWYLILNIFRDVLYPTNWLCMMCVFVYTYRCTTNPIKFWYLLSTDETHWEHGPNEN